MIVVRLLFNIYAAITSVYGTVYLSCLVVPKAVEDALWYIAVDHYAWQTFAVAAFFGAGWTWGQGQVFRQFRAGK